MVKRNVEIDDNLQEIIDSAIEDVKNELFEFLDDNPDTDETPDLNNDLDYSGRIHEIIDGAVPIYTKNQVDLWYLHGDKFEEAFDTLDLSEVRKAGRWDGRRQQSIATSSRK